MSRVRPVHVDVRPCVMRVWMWSQFSSIEYGTLMPPRMVQFMMRNAPASARALLRPVSRSCSDRADTAARTRSSPRFSNAGSASKRSCNHRSSRVGCSRSGIRSTLRYAMAGTVLQPGPRCIGAPPTARLPAITDCCELPAVSASANSPISPTTVPKVPRVTVTPIEWCATSDQ